jgi:uncharacterized protein (TIGR03435 family)
MIVIMPFSSFSGAGAFACQPALAKFGRRFRLPMTLSTALLLLAATLHAQPRFEVASVRHNRALACLGPWNFAAAHGAVNALRAPLRRIVSRAYNLTDDRVSGPAWLDSECYDIRAKAPANAADADLMPMLQTLLAERFHLLAQLDSAECPVFALVIDKGGSKLRAYDEKVAVPPSANGAQILFMARHLPDLCERLGKVTGRPVIDRTGLQGDYQIELAYLPFVPTVSDPADLAADIFSAVRNQLGLRLDSERAPVEILKIQSIDKVPTRN